MLFRSSETIKIFRKVEITEQFEPALLGLKHRVDAKIQELETLFPSKKPDIETLSDVLKHLGVNEDNTYLFAHGHTIKEHVLLPFLKSIVNELFKQKMTQINQVENETVRADNRRYYKNQIIPIEVALKTNTAFKSCFLYEKIENDLNKYIKYFE